MAMATGMFNAITGNPAEFNARSFAGQILRRYPNGAAPMFALTAQSGRSRAKATTHGYFSKTLNFLVFAMAGTQLVGDTTFTIPSTPGIVPGMLFLNSRTKEIIRVETVVSLTSITVRRAFGRVAAAAVNVADQLVNVGTAHNEGSNRPEARRLTTQYVPNYTQIFRNAWAVTDTARASYTEMGISNVTENKEDCAMFHAIDIESAIIWGQAYMDSSGTTPVHATQGVVDALTQYASANVNAAGGTTTYSQLVALMEPAFAFATNLGNPKTRVAFVDAQANRVLNNIGRTNGTVQIMQNQDKFGMRFTSFSFYKGDINIVEHPLLNGLSQTGMMLIMDMSALRLAYMEGRDTLPETYNIGNQGSPQELGKDAVGGSLTTELAVELINPYGCALVTGLTASAVG